MKTIAYFLFAGLLLLIGSCMKCNTCKQYCAHCEINTGVRYKLCSTKDINKAQVDSLYTALKAAGYTCTMLTDERNVCDYPNKLNDAVNYYYKQDYYCYPKP